MKPTTDTGKTGPQVVTVRMPEALHGKLVDAAHEQRTSMNKFCVSVIEKAVDRVLASGGVRDK